MGGVFSAIPSFWALPAQFLTGAAAAGGIGLINSIGNLGGFAAPYATGALNQFTGSDKAGMWAVGIFMIISPSWWWSCARPPPTGAGGKRSRRPTGMYATWRGGTRSCR